MIKQKCINDYSGEGWQKAEGIPERVSSQSTFFLYRFDFQIHANVLHMQEDEIK